MNFQDFQSEISNIIKSHFPNSYLHISGSSLGGRTNGSMFIHFAIGKDKSEWNHGIIHNDRGHTQIWIHGGFDVETGEVVGKLELQGSIIGYYMKNPPIRTDKCGWRNLKANVTDAKILKAIDSYFNKMAIKYKEEN